MGATEEHIMRKHYEVTLANLDNARSPHAIRVSARDREGAIKKAIVWARDPRLDMRAGGVLDIREMDDWEVAFPAK